MIDLNFDLIQLQWDCYLFTILLNRRDQVLPVTVNDFKRKKQKRKDSNTLGEILQTDTVMSGTTPKTVKEKTKRSGCLICYTFLRCLTCLLFIHNVSMVHRP